MPVAQARQQARCRPEHFNSTFRTAELVRKLLCRDLQPGQVVAAENQVDQMAERRISKGLALRQLELRKAAVVMPGDVINGVMIGRIGLDQDPPRSIAAAGPAGDLTEQREDPFGAAKVRQIKRRIGVQYPDQGHGREIMALGNHLRADQHINLA